MNAQFIIKNSNKKDDLDYIYDNYICFQDYLYNKKLNENDYTPLSEVIKLKMPKEYIFNTYEEITETLATLKMPDIGFIIHAEENLYITLETEEYKSLSKYNTPR